MTTPEYFNQTKPRIELDDFDNFQFIDSSFTASKFLIDRYFDVDENNDFQPKV